MLSYEHLAAVIGVDTAQNGTVKSFYQKIMKFGVHVTNRIRQATTKSSDGNLAAYDGLAIVAEAWTACVPLQGGAAGVRTLLIDIWSGGL